MPRFSVLRHNPLFEAISMVDNLSVLGLDHRIQLGVTDPRRAPGSTCSTSTSFGYAASGRSLEASYICTLPRIRCLHFSTNAEVRGAPRWAVSAA